MLAATFELRGLRLELAKDRTLTVIDGATRRRISLSELSQQGDTVMADILNAQGNPYFDNVDVSRPQDGDWFRSEYSVISYAVFCLKKKKTHACDGRRHAVDNTVNTPGEQGASTEQP